MLSRQKFIHLTVILAVLFFAGAVQAAWRDAPAGPPNYDELTPGSTQADYKPLNLGSSVQTKKGGVNLAIDPGTQIGIGTVTGGGKLAVKAVNSQINLLSDSTDWGLILAKNLSTQVIDGYNGPNYAYLINFHAAPLLFGTGNAEKMRITSAGNVGIGTAGPGAKLEAIQTSGASTNSPNTVLILDSEPSTTTVAGGGAAIEFRGKSSGGNIANYQQARIRSVGYDTNNAHGIAFDVKPSAAPPLTEAMRIDPGGNVGIGTTGPKGKLDIEGNYIKDSTTIDISSVWTNVLSINLGGDHRSVYVKLFYGGTDWTCHSATRYQAEFEVVDGASGYSEPGRIIFQKSNTESDQIQARLVHIDPDTVNIQLRTYDIEGNGFSCADDTPGGSSKLVYEVEGQFVSVGLTSGTVTTSNENPGVVIRKGNVGINNQSPAARLVVNNPSTAGKIGSSGDALYAYANSTNAAVSVEQVGSGYAIYASGGFNYFSGNVGIGTTGPNKRLEVREDNNATTVTTGILVANPSLTNDSRAGIVFLNYDNYGAAIWSPRTGSAAGKLMFGTNSGAGIVETNIGTRMTIDSGGNVGIGTTGPGAKLHIEDLQATAGVTALIHNRDNSIATTQFTRLLFRGMGNNAGAGTWYMGEIRAVREGDWSSATTAVDSGIAFYTTKDTVSGEKVRIDNSGNVGIGTAGPGAKLEAIQTSGASTNSPNTVLILDSEPSTTTVAGGGAAIEFRGKSSGGNIANYQQARIRSVGYDTNNAHGIAFDVKPSAAPPLTEAMRIDPGGNVGIGTAGPGYKLDVVGDVNITGAYRVNGVALSSTGGVTGSGSSGYDSFLPKWISSSNNTLGYSDIYNSGGNVGIGTTTPGSYKLNVVGDIYTSGSGTAVDGWFVSSDARLKKNVETLSGALEKLGRVRGVSYDLASGQGARQIGVIAQELEQEFPELIKTDANGYKAVAYDRLSAVLIEAVKELKAQNQALQLRLDLLEKK